MAAQSLLPRSNGRRPPAPGSAPGRALRGLAVAATSVTFLLIAVGGLVRGTGSGDACPDWPRCFGRWIPPLDYHVLIEYTHRLTATLAILLVIALAAVAWARYRTVGRVLAPALAAVGLIVVQAALGGVVVLRGLRALDVTAHLGTAMLLAGSLVYVTVAAFSPHVPVPPVVSRFTLMARGTAGAVLALILLGATVRAQGAGLAFVDWPLMDGRLVPDLSVGIKALHFTHRVFAVVVGVLVAWLAVRARRAPARNRSVAVLCGLGAGLFGVQVLVGAAAVWSRLAPAAIVAHVALSSLIWGSLVAAASASRVVLVDHEVPVAEPAEPPSRVSR